MAGVERVPVHIPGVEVVGDFPIKRFLETIYNAAAKQYGVKLNATIMPFAGCRRAAELEKQERAGMDAEKELPRRL